MERASSRISLWGLRIWVEDRQAVRERGREEGRVTQTLSGDGNSRSSQYYKGDA